MCPGRRRTFNKEEALARAMEVFWCKGYSAASLSDLTEAMGINKPSLYAAFGNKEQLFVSAINQYVHEYGVPHFDTLMESSRSLKDRVRAYLRSIASMALDPRLPGGCFVTTSTCEAGSRCLPKEAELTILKINEASKDTFVRFFRDEQMKGNTASTAAPEVLADYLLTLQFGLAVMARDDIDSNRLDEIISYATANL